MEDQDRTSRGAAEKEILAAQVEYGYGQLPISLVVNLVNGFILAAVLWDVTILPKLLVWCMVLIAVTGARYYMLRAFRAVSYTHLTLPTICFKCRCRGWAGE